MSILTYRRLAGLKTDGAVLSNDYCGDEVEMRVVFASGFFFVACAAAAVAQSSSDSTSRRSTGNDALVAWATVWGDVGRTGVFTCDEWKRYATKLFNDADKNRDGYLSGEEFNAIRKADPMFKIGRASCRERVYVLV